MLKQIINKPTDKKSEKTGVFTPEIEFVMFADSHAKQIMTQLLKKYMLHIELYDKKLITATYKGTKILGRTEPDILLVYDINTQVEVELYLSDIRLVRVSK